MTAVNLARLAVAAAALAVTAWLALGLRASHLETEGSAPIERLRSRVPTRAEADRAIRLLERSRSFNADNDPLVEEATLLYATGRLGRAASLARRVVRAEPANLSAWRLLLLVYSRRDPTLLAEARSRIRALDPYAPLSLPSGGLATAGLVSNQGTDVIVRPSGATVAVRAGVVAGVLEQVSRYGSTLVISGWAADKRHRRAAAQILVFGDGAPLVTGRPTLARKDVQRQYHAPRSGFRLWVATSRARQADRPGRLRVFALAGNVATELRPLETAFTSRGHAGPVAMIGRDWIARPSGVRARLRPSAVNGALERVTRRGRTLVMSGWAADGRRRKPVAEILAFSEGRPIAFGRPTVVRRDIKRKYGVSLAGFRLRVVTSRARAIDRPSRLQVFAVSGSVASSLVPLSLAFPGSG